MIYIAITPHDHSLSYAEFIKVDERNKSDVRFYDSIIGSYMYEKLLFHVEYITKKEYDRYMKTSKGLLSHSWIVNSIINYKKIISKDEIAYIYFTNWVCFVYNGVEEINTTHRVTTFVKDNKTYEAYYCNDKDSDVHMKLYVKDDPIYICNIPRHESAQDYIISRL